MHYVLEPNLFWTNIHIYSYIIYQIERDNIDSSVFIHQSKYVKEILKRFNMSNAKSVCVPLDPNVILQPVRARN